MDNDKHLSLPESESCILDSEHHVQGQSELCTPNSTGDDTDGSKSTALGAIKPKKMERAAVAEAFVRRYLDKVSAIAKPIDRFVKTLFALGLLGALGVFAAATMLVGTTSVLRLVVLFVFALIIAAPIVVLRVYHNALYELIELPKSVADFKSEMLTFFDKHHNEDDKKLSVKFKIYFFSSRLKSLVDDIRDLVGPRSPILILANPMWAAIAGLSLALSMLYQIMAPLLLLIALVL